MEIGAFSVSLSVKDLDASRSFYEALGFEPSGGDAAQGWLIMRSGPTVIGLFKGMFEGNLLTFSPGWDQYARELPSFDDIRTIQKRLKEKGLRLTSEADEAGKGPASFTLEDPDGNRILFDQYV